jgi:glycosyl hydrolase family 2/HEAT repeat protein
VRRLIPLLTVALVMGLLVPTALLASGAVLQRRADLYKLAAAGPNAAPQLAAALDDENGIVRRTAARLLAEIGKPAEKALVGALANSDVVVRRTALNAVCDLLKGEAMPHLAKAMSDESAFVRHVAIGRLVTIKPRTEQIDTLLKAARKDKSKAIRIIANKAMWPFHKETVLLRERKDYDHVVKLVKTVPMPKQGWRFKLDPSRDGHLRKWHQPKFKDADWGTIAIEQAWQKAGYEYIGVSWYRRWIELPARPDHTAVELHFDGVDESAWVWVNGQYVGQHDIGPMGWNIAFGVDITKAVKWGQKNQITVRAMNTAHAGGIWKPMRIEILK